jgi:hypothetical protein
VPPQNVGEGKIVTGPGGEFEDVAARAARLGVTVDKVLQEYAWIAFADLRHIVDWDPNGFHLKQSGGMSEGDVAPIQEIVADASGSRPYRVKLYDKKAALDAIARHLGMFPAPRPEDAEPLEPAEDPREILARELARLASGTRPS